MRTTVAPVASSSAFKTLVPRCHAPARPSLARRRVKVGTNEALMAPSANRSRTRLGMRKATTNASISLPAPKSAASTWSRASPRTRLVSVAVPARAAECARRSRPALGAKLFPDQIVYSLAVDRLPGQPRQRRLHRSSEVLGRGRAGFGDGRDDRGFDDGRIGGRRQVGFEDRDLGGFPGRQVLAPALLELIDRVSALFDQRGDNLLPFAVVERVPFLDSLVAVRRLHPA